MPDPQPALQYARAHSQAAVDSLQEALRIPSISTLSEKAGDVRRAADWFAGQLEAMGFDSVDVLPTAKHPVVCGELMQAGPSAPTVLFYGHYDVQPVDPIDLWLSDPFEPTIRGEDLFARGASDMKGQVVAHLKAVEAMVRTSGLPINLKYLIEGEEEIGSPSLAEFVRRNKARLAADFCLNADTSIIAPDVPALTYGLRGLAYHEIRLQGATGDLHSGTFGGAVDNPGMVLSRLLAGMKDPQGRITLPGFYDRVRPLSVQERAALAALPQDDGWWKKAAGVRELAGEEGFTSTERATARPTLDVNGLLCGFTGQGSKTVLPARAMAKISMRLVPDQLPQEVKAGVEQYLKASVPSTMTWELEDLASCTPAIVDLDTPAVRAAQAALETVWGRPALFTRMGGSVPVVSLIQDLLGLDSLLLGFGLPDDNLHAPNEKQHLPNFRRGIESYIWFSHLIAG
jgi:acetylornithine deacetylase/succinyl-diaminopimelate desuccinylase-like protein